MFHDATMFDTYLDNMRPDWHKRSNGTDHTVSTFLGKQSTSSLLTLTITATQSSEHETQYNQSKAGSKEAGLVYD